MNKEKLTELVYINLGRASMCWSEIPKGVFDSTKAAELGKEIMEAIEKYVEVQEEDKRPGWVDPMIEMLDREEKESEWQRRRRLDVIREAKKKEKEEKSFAQRIAEKNDKVGVNGMGNPIYRYEGVYYTLDPSFKKVLEMEVHRAPNWWWGTSEPK
jgi:septum formation topological specificity factor MinE